MNKYTVEYTATLIFFDNDKDRAEDRASNLMAELGVDTSMFSIYTTEEAMEGRRYEVRQVLGCYEEEPGVWTVDNSTPIAEVIIDDDMENKDILNLLKEYGFSEEDLTLLRVAENGDTIEVVADGTEEPVFMFWPIDD